MKPKQSEDNSIQIKGSETSRWFTTILFGVFMRFVLFVSGFHETFARRIEIVSPVTSWHRVTECVTLASHGISPYTGDVCHHAPLLVHLFLLFPKNYIPWLFITIDIVAAVLLYFAARLFTEKQLRDQESEKQLYSENVETLLLDQGKLRDVPLYMMAFYLFNPCSLLSCVAQSTVLISNVITSLSLLLMLKGWFSIACVFTILASYLSLYPLMLLVPICLFSYNTTNSITSIIKCVITCLLASFVLLVSSFYITNSWDFLHSVYGFMLEAPDLTPNMGLFWYFFLEMFDHFRLFFLWVYQINAFIYVVPLAIVFKKQPVLIFYSLLSVITLFKSYSTIADLTLPIAMLPLWSYCYRYGRNVLLIIGMLLITLVLAPCMWHLWIYAGSGNANFFYAVTLAYSTAQIFLVSDVLYAYLKYDYHLKNGLSPKTVDGKDGTVVMK